MSAPRAAGPRLTAVPNPQRRGLGVIFIIFGLLCCSLMTAAALYALGHLRVRISAAAWQQMYLAHFFCTTGCGAGYLWLGYRQTGANPSQGIMDLTVGLFLYAVVLLVTGLLLLAGRIAPWFSIVPGIFLIYYGWVLRQGRAIWTAIELPNPRL